MPAKRAAWVNVVTSGEVQICIAGVRSKEFAASASADLSWLPVERRRRRCLVTPPGMALNHLCIGIKAYVSATPAVDAQTA